MAFLGDNILTTAWDYWFGDDDEKVTVETTGGKVTIPKSQLPKIEETKDPETGLITRVAKMSPEEMKNGWIQPTPNVMPLVMVAVALGVGMFMFAGKRG